MRAGGLSRMKVAYLKDLAGRFHEGTLKPRRWARMDDEAMIEDLVQVKGIGRWSVEMFLIFHLMRPTSCRWATSACSARWSATTTGANRSRGTRCAGSASRGRR